MNRLQQYLRQRHPEIADLEADYPWDDWARTDKFMFATEEIGTATQDLSINAVRGLCISIGHWLTYALSRGSRAAELEQYLDAAWGQMLSETYCEYLIAETPDWCGPYDGVLWAAGLIVNDTLFEMAQDRNCASRACWSVNLARFVFGVTAKAHFDPWLAAVLPRLRAGHAAPESPLFAERFSADPPCPPSLFALDGPPSEDGRREIRDLVRAIPADNTFVATPLPT